MWVPQKLDLVLSLMLMPFFGTGFLTGLHCQAVGDDAPAMHRLNVSGWGDTQEEEESKEIWGKRTFEGETGMDQVIGMHVWFRIKWIFLPKKI